MKSTLLFILLCYVGLCLVLYLLQRQMIYMPQPARAVKGVTTLRFHRPEVPLQGWQVNGQQPRALLYYGGNAENIEDNIPFFQQVLSDYTVYLVPYRGYGYNPGAPAEQDLYRDALWVFDQLQPRHKSIAVMGRSLGSGVATYVAAHKPVTRLLLVTPFDSMENVARDIYWMFPVSLLLKDKFASADRVNAITAPTYIVMAEHDRVIPRRRSQALVEKFGDRLEASFVIDNAGHNNISFFPQYIAAVREALAERL